MKNFKFTINDNKYDVDIKDVEGNIATVKVNGTEYKVEINEGAKAVKKAKSKKAKAVPVSASESIAKTETPKKSGTPVKAPLPGNIWKLNVKDGDVVEKGDVILILEAMKMENNIVAEKNGTVVNVQTKEGAAVLQNDTLLEIA